MISLDDARRQIASRLEIRDSVRVPLAHAAACVLAEPILADAAYPSADRSTMDGYVIGGDEMPGTFPVVGEIPAGVLPHRALAAGEAMRIFTGAVIPPGGGRVVMQEDVRREGDSVVIGKFSENRFIRPAASEASPGDVVLAVGTRIGAAELAILAQVGASYPLVVRKPVVRHIATGDELVAPEITPGPAKIRDSNSSLVAGLCREFDVPFSTSRAVDDPASISSTAAIAGGDWDLLLISGGASVGDHDFGAESLRRLGFEIHFDRVDLRPGKPLTFATRGAQAAFVIPGNPVSHFVCFHVAIRLALEIFCGLPPRWDFLPLEIDGGEPLKTSPRETFWPAQARVRAGQLVVSPKRWSTSGDTFSLAGTNALCRVPADAPPSGPVPTLLLDLPAAPH